MSELELPSRSEVEDLFYQEAALLDEWRLEDWLELLTDDAIYQIPPTEFPKEIRATRYSSSPMMPFGSDRGSSSSSAGSRGPRILIRELAA